MHMSVSQSLRGKASVSCFKSLPRSKHGPNQGKHTTLRHGTNPILCFDIMKSEKLFNCTNIRVFFNISNCSTFVLFF